MVHRPTFLLSIAFCLTTCPPPATTTNARLSPILGSVLFYYQPHRILVPETASRHHIRGHQSGQNSPQAKSCSFTEEKFYLVLFAGGTRRGEAGRGKNDVIADKCCQLHLAPRQLCEVGGSLFRSYESNYEKLEFKCCVSEKATTRSLTENDHFCFILSC